jgi:hypothetical protein
MCGIFGIYGDDLNVSPINKKNLIIEGTIADTVRGYESTGIFNIGRNKNDPDRIYKRALPGYDMVQLKQFNRVVDQMHTSIAMVVHNRATTRGNTTDSNAHPFHYGDITLVHNGTVYNAENLVPKKEHPEHIQVDSAYVAHALSLENPEDILPKLNGPFSLVWWDSTLKTLNFARNEQKPMFIAFEKDRNTVLFGSEVRMITWLAGRNDIKLQNEIFETDPNVHYEFAHPKNVRGIRKIPFVPGWKKQGDTRTTSKLPAVQAPKESTTTPWEPTKTTPTTTTSSSTQGTGTVPTSSPAYYDKTSNPVEAEVVADATVPALMRETKSDERKTKLIDMMNSQGLGKGEQVLLIPRVWRPYRMPISDQISRHEGNTYGVMSCYKHGDDKKVVRYQVFGISAKQWRTEFNGNKACIAQIINYREKAEFEDIGPVFVCTVREDLQQKHAHRVLEEETAQAPAGGGTGASDDVAGCVVNTETGEVRKLPLVGGDKLDATLLKKTVGEAVGKRQPRNIYVGTARKRWVPIDWYRAVTNDGCYNCSCPLPEQIANTIMWIGDDDNIPLCEVCQGNEVILEAMKTVTKNTAMVMH